jgi:hypothetical protein
MRSQATRRGCDTPRQTRRRLIDDGADFVLELECVPTAQLHSDTQAWVSYNYPVPTPKEGEILLKLSHTGICVRCFRSAVIFSSHQTRCPTCTT